MLSTMSDIYTRLAEGIASIKQPHFDIAYCLSTLSKNGWYTSYGCSNIYELAERDFGLGKTSVKNYIAVCDKFMHGDTVISTFADYSYTALVEMTSISVYDWQFIKPNMSIKAIRQWKQDHKFVTLEDGSVRMLSELSRSERESYEDYKASLKDSIKGSQSTDRTIESISTDNSSVEYVSDVPYVKPSVVEVSQLDTNVESLIFNSDLDYYEFLSAYHKWPVWVSVPDLYLTVYRYNFANGISICATQFGSYEKFTANPDKRCTSFRFQIIDKKTLYDLSGVSFTEIIDYLKKNVKDL